MKNRLFVAALAAAVMVLGAVQQSVASIRTVSVGDVIQIRTNLNYRTGTGGEFQLRMQNGPDSFANHFHTFCAETNVVLGSNPYTVTSIGTSINNNGTPGTLTVGAANLFRDYYDAMISRDYGYQNVVGLEYSGGAPSFVLGGDVTFDMTTNLTRELSGQAVQQALWKMLGYNVSVSGAAGLLFNHYQNASTDVSLFRGVRLATLVDRNNNISQGQFVVIPEPGSLLVWGVLGLAGAGMTNRRRRS